MNQERHGTDQALFKTVLNEYVDGFGCEYTEVPPAFSLEEVLLWIMEHFGQK